MIIIIIHIIFIRSCRDYIIYATRGEETSGRKRPLSLENTCAPPMIIFVHNINHGLWSQRTPVYYGSPSKTMYGRYEPQRFSRVRLEVNIVVAVKQPRAAPPTHPIITSPLRIRRRNRTNEVAPSPI